MILYDCNEGRWKIVIFNFSGKRLKKEIKNLDFDIDV